MTLPLLVSGCMTVTSGSLEGYCDATLEDRERVAEVAAEEASDALVVPLARWIAKTDRSCGA